MIEIVKKEVNKLLNTDNSGHGMDHILRVLNLSLQFAKKEKCDEKLVSLIALLHDVDDYKLFGEESQKNLTNTKAIMKKAKIDSKTQDTVCEAVRCIGYSKRLKGIIPSQKEAMIVSDADMCDAIGATGIMRVQNFGLKIDRPFFEKEIFPIDNQSYDYHKKKTASTINFIIEVLLKYKELMLTESGKKEALLRHDFMIQFLKQYFTEQNATEWFRYLDE